MISLNFSEEVPRDLENDNDKVSGLHFHQLSSELKQSANDNENGLKFVAGRNY
jgi:hypothetical protein